MKCIEKISEKITVQKVGLIFIALGFLTILLFAYSGGIKGNDFWWHVKVGEWIVENGRIPTTDIFSWYGMGKELPWTAHEWLSDVIFYEILQVAGQGGVYYFSLFSAALMGFLILYEVRSYVERNLPIAIAFFVTLAVVLSIFFYGRPHLFSFFLLFFELKILYGYWKGNNWKCLFGLPVVGCLWSNLHGGSSNMAYILCGVFLFAGICKFDIGRLSAKPMERIAWFRLLGAFVATVLSVFVNPIGFSVLTFPYSSMGSDIMMRMISEWMSPDAKDLGTLLFFFMPIVVMTIGIVTEKKKLYWHDILVMGIFLWLFLRSSRFIMLWFIAASFYAFPYVLECKVKEIKTKAEKLVLIICFLIFLIPSVVVLYESTQLEEEAYIETVMSKEAIQAVKESEYQKIFNDYNLGEALIYNGIPVFFDARADMYLQQNIFADGCSLMNLYQYNEEAETTYVNVDLLIEKYGFEAILIKKDRPLYTYILSHPEQFSFVYEDETVAYYEIRNRLP